MNALALVFTLLFSGSAEAQSRIRIDVADLTDQTSAEEACNVTSWWSGLLSNMNQYLQVSLSQSDRVTVVEGARARMYRPSFDSNMETVYRNDKVANSQLSVRGSLQKFNLCQTPGENGTHLAAKVAIKIHIVNAKSGEPVDEFVADGIDEEDLEESTVKFRGAPLGSGVFKESSLGKAMMVALAAANQGILDRLPTNSVNTSGDRLEMIPRK